MTTSGREALNAHPADLVCAKIFSDVISLLPQHTEIGDCLDICVPFPRRDEKTEYKRSGGADKGMEKPESLFSDALMLLCKLGPTLLQPHEL